VFDWAHSTPEGAVKVITVGGKPDIPARVAEQNVIVDWKCTTQPITNWWVERFHTIGHQVRIYIAMMRFHYGIYVESAYIDGIHIGEHASADDAKWKTLKTPRSKMFGPFTFSSAQLQDTWRWINTLAEARAVYEREGFWPQSESHCSAYGGCIYKGICGKPEGVRNALKARDFKVWKSEGLLLSGADK
jgi:hypothetical protein